MNNDRYYVSENEDYEPDSDQVLKNDLGIKDRQVIEALEERELERTGIQMIELYSEDLTLRTERVNRPYFLAPALQSDSLVQSIYTL